MIAVLAFGTAALIIGILNADRIKEGASKVVAKVKSLIHRG